MADKQHYREVFVFGQKHWSETPDMAQPGGDTEETQWSCRNTAAECRLHLLSQTENLAFSVTQMKRDCGTE